MEIKYDIVDSHESGMPGSFVVFYIKDGQQGKANNSLVGRILNSGAKYKIVEDGRAPMSALRTIESNDLFVRGFKINKNRKWKNITV